MNFINKITQSRKIILEMLELRNYDISKYSNFTNNEIDIMLKTCNKKLSSDNNCLDMIFDHKENSSKCLVKYIIFNKPNNYDPIIIFFDDMALKLIFIIWIVSFYILSVL